jgi:alkylhydroperoxidase family enzyme
MNMARIPGASPIAEFEQIFSNMRRGMAELTGRELDRALEPLELYAHVPELFRGMLALQQAGGGAGRIDTRLSDLARLKAATLTNCEYCIDVGSLISRRSGLSDEMLLALPNYHTSPLFTEVEKLVLDYAVGMSRTPVGVSEELFARLREHFDNAQIVELTHMIAGENMAGRFNHALGVGSAGFSAGMVCAVPERAPAPTTTWP